VDFIWATTCGFVRRQVHSAADGRVVAGMRTLVVFGPLVKTGPDL